jgi:transcriptional regulator with XRE-family HTH domain
MASHEDLAAVVVRTVTAARRALGWSQRELAARAGVSQTLVARFERGEIAAVSLTTVEALFDALGVRADLRTDLPVVDPRQSDAVHAVVGGFLGRRLEGHAFEIRHEVEVGSGRFRGWIDVLAYRPADRSLLTNEIKTDLPDVGGLQRTLSWYEREAWTVARKLGWRPVRQVVALIGLDSAQFEDRLFANRTIIDAAFQGRAAGLARWVEDPAAPPPTGRCLALVDPAWRGRRWLRPSRLDGRRSPPRYADYRDAAGRIGRR